MFSSEELRVAVNVQQAYDSANDVVRELRNYRHSIGWKTIREQDYLYDNSANKSLGVRSELTQAQYASYSEKKRNLQSLHNSYEFRLKTQCAFYKAAKLPLIDSDKAKLCRALDEHSLLGTAVIVVGTVCIAAYELEAQERFDAPLTTEDIDLSWVRKEDAGEPILWPALKEFDQTFCVTERSFTARNRSGIILDLISSLERIATAKRKPLQAIVLEGQEWLLNGTWVSQVVCGTDRTPCRIVAPDPRWFALHKWWLSHLPNRNPMKVRKDRAHAKIVWNALPNMGRFPIDDAFLAQLAQVPQLASAYEQLQSITTASAET
jgi:Nucleotidyltransferase